MEPQNLIASSEIMIDTSIAKVWDALVNPDTIKKYMFGTTVVSDWKVGSEILWKGEWKGKAYEDKGTILQLQPNAKLQYRHFSPLTGEPDIPDNYHTVTIELTGQEGHTKVTLTQNKNATEEAKKHSEDNWNQMLAGMKKMLDKS